MLSQLLSHFYHQTPSLLVKGQLQGQVKNSQINCQVRGLQTASTLHRARSHTHYYDVLQLTPYATPAQIKAAFYELSKKYHPDSNPDGETSHKFHEIVEAYEILGNQITRKKYDRGLMKPPSQSVTPDTEDKSFSPKTYKKRSDLHTGSTDGYNFDEYYRQHYGEQVLRTFQRKQRMREGRRRESSTKQLPGHTHSPAHDIRFERYPPQISYFLVWTLLGSILLGLGGIFHNQLRYLEKTSEEKCTKTK